MSDRPRASAVTRFDACRVLRGSPLRDVLQSLDQSGLEIALVEGDDGRAIGVMTDGDVRRALLAGATLDTAVDPYVSTGFTSVGSATSRAEVLDLMQSRRIGEVPIVGSAGRFEGLHTLHDLLGGTVRPNWAVIMAGGRGERLRPLTDAMPKPMLRVAGRPILERIVLHLVGSGIRRIFLSVNYRADIIEAHFGTGAAFGCEIEYLREDTPLGTGGALSLLPSGASDPVLVLNGDLLTEFDVGRMFGFHDRGRFLMTIGVHEHSHSVPLGVVEVDGGRVRNLREKPTEVWQVNAGIYVIEPGLIGRVPAKTHFGITTLVEGCLDLGEPVGAFHLRGEWIDLGHHDELKRARGEG